MTPLLAASLGHTLAVGVSPVTLGLGTMHSSRMTQNSLESGEGGDRHPTFVSAGRVFHLGPQSVCR